MHIEIETVDALRAHIATHGGLDTVVVQGLDLRSVTDLLLTVRAAGAAFLGCAFEDPALEHVTRTGGVVMPELAGLPYQPYRPRLYTPDELMEGYERGRHASFATRTRDARIYAHYSLYRNTDAPLPVLEALAQRLHDHAIDDALHDFLTDASEGPRRVVGIMGGHAMRRDAPAFRDVARLAQRLARRGYLVATGGGPGAMEAANLGAWLAEAPDGAVDRAVARLAAAPTYADEGWFDTAYDARAAHPAGAASLAIPTWFYGHEPTNLFATHVAKYFSNSLREDGLLAIARHGVVYAPGSAGTVQEIFMDAAQNHYGTFGEVSPMVLLGRHYWTVERPVLPLLAGMARGRQYERLVFVCDDPDEAAAFIEAHPPVRYAP